MAAQGASGIDPFPDKDPTLLGVRMGSSSNWVSMTSRTNLLSQLRPWPPTASWKCPTVRPWRIFSLTELSSLALQLFCVQIIPDLLQWEKPLRVCQTPLCGAPASSLPRDHLVHAYYPKLPPFPRPCLLSKTSSLSSCFGVAFGFWTCFCQHCLNAYFCSCLMLWAEWCTSCHQNAYIEVLTSQYLTLWTYLEVRSFKSWLKLKWSH